MALKFNCTKCGQEIVVKYIRFGEIAQCGNCKNEVEVPIDAIRIEDVTGVTKADKSVTIDINKNRLAVSELKEISPEEQQYALKEFKSKRKKQIIVYVFVVLFQIVMILLFHGKSNEIYLLCFGVIFLTVIYTWFNWRCQKCKIGLSSIEFNIPYCPNCGVKLK